MTLCTLLDLGETSTTLSLKHCGIAMNIPFFGLPSNPSFVAGLNTRWCSGSTCFATYSLFFSKKFSWLQIIVKQPLIASNILMKSCLQLPKPLELYEMMQTSELIIVSTDLRRYPFQYGPVFLLAFGFLWAARTKCWKADTQDLIESYQKDVS